jgi:DNA-binding XRE family transcriptional regulator
MEKEAQIRVGKLVFSATLPLVQIGDKAGFALDDLARLERDAARWIIEHGAVSSEAIRFLRKRAKLTAAQLAELLDTTPETISRWENGNADFVRGTWNTVAALALDAMNGRDETARRLRAIQEIRGGQQHIEIHLKAS